MAPHATEHQSLRGRSIIPHVIKRGVIHNWPPAKVKEHDQGGIGCRRCLLPGKLRIEPPQPMTSFQGLPGGGALGPSGRAVRPRVFSPQTNTPFVSPNCGCPGEPSEASDGNVVVYAVNQRIAFSTNFGATFSSFAMGAFFPTNAAGGPSGDQVIQYVPSINRFVWLLQYWAGPTGANIDRLTVFPPSSVSPGGLTGPFTYWDLPSLSPTWKFEDFPDLAVGSQYLYFTTNLGKGGFVYQTEIARIGLSNLQLSLNLAAPPHAWRYILGGLFFGRVAQNTGVVAYWAVPANTSQMNVSWWPEAGTFWFGPVTINNLTWPNAGFASYNPDKNNWNSTYTGVILAAAVTPGPNGSHLWLAWPAGVGTGQEAWLSQPNVQLLEISVPGMKFTAQTTIWNPAYAFSFPALAVSRSGDLGIDLGWGGHGSLWTNTAVTDWFDTPYIAWNMTSSTASDGGNRWGDYIDIRPEFGMSPTGGPWPANGFTASGIGTVVNPTAPGSRLWDLHYIAFSG